VDILNIVSESIVVRADLQTSVDAKNVQINDAELFCAVYCH